MSVIGDLLRSRRGESARQSAQFWLAAGVATGAAIAAGAPTEARTIDFERGGARFAQLNSANGSLVLTRRRAYHGKRSARATYHGHGANGYARGIERVKWHADRTVAYGAAFFLPRGFRRKMQGPVSLIRWDNWPSNREAGDIGGLVIFGKDRRIHLVYGGYDRGYERDLVRPLKPPEGRWVHLEVRQRLSKGRGARNDLYVDGRRIRRSREPNTAGRTIERVRFGLVSMAAGRQVRGLTLFFDRATLGRRRHGPR